MRLYATLNKSPIHAQPIPVRIVELTAALCHTKNKNMFIVSVYLRSPADMTQDKEDKEK